MTWLETNKEVLENAHMKNLEKLQIEHDIISFSSKDAERLIVAVYKYMEKCTEFYKKMHQVHNKCHLSSTAKSNDFQEKDQHVSYLQDILHEDEQNIQKIKTISE